MRKLTSAIAAGAMAMVLCATPAGADPTDLQVSGSLPGVSEAELMQALKGAEGQKPQKLRAARPAWFTKKLERKVRRRGVVSAPVDAPLPGEVGIRPGSWMIAPYWCTMNFLFQKSGVLGIGTAGHCVDGTKPILLTVAPGGANPVLVELGRVLLKRDAGIGKDFAIVEVPTNVREWAFPTIGVVGGPCGIYSGMAPQPIAHYGHGVGVGTGGTPRAGMGIHLEDDPFALDLEWDTDSFAWVGLLNGGDSGSAVRIGQLPAVGDLTHGLTIAGLPTPSAIGWGTRITTITSSGWQLVNSPLCA